MSGRIRSVTSEIRSQNVSNDENSLQASSSATGRTSSTREHNLGGLQRRTSQAGATNDTRGRTPPPGSNTDSTREQYLSLRSLTPQNVPDVSAHAQATTSTHPAPVAPLTGHSLSMTLAARALSEIVLPRDGTQEVRHLVAAQSISSWMRKNVYTKESLKSGDKMDLRKDRAQEKLRVTQAREEIQRVRNEAEANPALRGYLALSAKAFNCSELASAAACLAQQMGLTAHVVGNDSHEYAVLGDIPAAGLPKHIQDWPAHLVICDVYANVVCAPQDYVAGLTKKLNQWTDEQKLLHDGRRWFKPNDPAMISDVVIGERAIYLH